MTAHGRFFDGAQGTGQDVILHVDAAALQVRDAQSYQSLASWPLEDVRVVKDHAQAGLLMLRLQAKEESTARLSVSDPALAAKLTEACTHLYKRDGEPGTRTKVATRLALAAGALALMLFVIVPGLANMLAPLIPMPREVAYGKTVVSQMERIMGGGTRAGGLACTHPDGVAALKKMEARLIDGREMAYALEIKVFDHKMVNAFAAPGGQIVLLRGLIEKARSPDEVAAVLAHEIGHVEARDVTRNALRVAGTAGLLSLLFGDFSGGAAAVAVAEHMLNTSYTREAEAAADRFAADMLREARVDVAALARFFEALDAMGGTRLSLPGYLATHPRTADRAAAARVAATGQGPTGPILSAAEWRALRGICAGAAD